MSQLKITKKVKQSRNKAEIGKPDVGKLDVDVNLNPEGNAKDNTKDNNQEEIKNQLKEIMKDINKNDVNATGNANANTNTTGNSNSSNEVKVNDFDYYANTFDVIDTILSQHNNRELVNHQHTSYKQFIEKDIGDVIRQFNTRKFSFKDGK